MFLLFSGRPGAARDLYDTGSRLSIEAGDVDGAASQLQVEAAVLAEIEEVELAREGVARVEALMAAPELSPIQRSVVGVQLYQVRGAIAWTERDAPALRALGERLGKLPPERTEGIDAGSVAADLDLRRRALEGADPADLWPATLQDCDSNTARGRMYAANDDSRATAAFEAAAARADCVLPQWQFLGNLEMAERRLAEGKPEEARAYAQEARVAWPRPEPEVRWAKRLLAVEAALPPP